MPAPLPPLSHSSAPFPPVCRPLPPPQIRPLEDGYAGAWCPAEVLKALPDTRELLISLLDENRDTGGARETVRVARCRPAPPRLHPDAAAAWVEALAPGDALELWCAGRGRGSIWQRGWGPKCVARLPKLPRRWRRTQTKPRPHAPQPASDACPTRSLPFPRLPRPLPTPTPHTRSQPLSPSPLQRHAPSKSSPPSPPFLPPPGMTTPGGRSFSRLAPPTQSWSSHPRTDPGTARPSPTSGRDSAGARPPAAGRTRRARRRSSFRSQTCSWRTSARCRPTRSGTLRSGQPRPPRACVPRRAACAGGAGAAAGVAPRVAAAVPRLRFRAPSRWGRSWRSRLRRMRSIRGRSTGCRQRCVLALLVGGARGPLFCAAPRW
jgi:hypothetical protein